MLRRNANAQNPNKVQRDIGQGDVRLPRKFQHASDISARTTNTRAKQREEYRANLEIPANRIYDVVNQDVGYDHSRVTLSGNSAIVWNNHSQQWEPATYAMPEVVTNKTVRVVRGNNGNRQAGGNF